MAYEPNEFGYKDRLPAGDPDKVIKGSDFDVEFNAIKEALDSVDVEVNVDDVNGLEELLGDKAEQDDLDALSAELQQEIADREAADVVLQGNIDSLGTNDLADVSSEDAEKDQFLIHNGTQWVAEDFHVETDLTFIAGISVSSDPAPTAEAGDVYLNNEEGVAGESWTGIAGKLVNVANAIGWSEVRSRWYLLGDVFSDVYWQQSGDDIYYADGNVGIGTTDPASKLHVKVATDENIKFLTGGSGDARISAVNDANSATTQLSLQGDPLIFRTFGGDEQMRIEASGNVIVKDRISLVRLSGDLDLPIARYWDGTGKPLTGNTNKGDQLAIGAAGGLGLDLITNDVAQVKIDADGKVGIGGEPGTRTAADYIDQAKAKIKSWTAAIKTKLDEEPKANKKAVTLEVTDDAFEVIPTEDLVAEWMAERAIGGGDAKLQVAGDVYATGALEVVSGHTRLTGSALYDQTGKGGGDVGIRFQAGAVVAASGAGAAAGDTKDLGSTATRWRNGHFSGDVNANRFTSGQFAAASTTTYFQLNSGSTNVLELRETIFFPYTNDYTTLGRSDKRWKDGYFSGTIYGTVDDVPSHVKAITPTQIANWDAGTGGGGGGAATDGRISDTQITNWDQAHGWGNHATAGYQPAGSYAAANHNHSGVYQPAGNYALVGASYTKAESDGKYELKGAGGLPAGDWACTGSITAAGNITAYSSSDERLKDNIEAMPVGLIDDIKPSTWNWKDGGKASGGVVAQQLQSCGLEQWVNEAPNGDLGVDYNALIGVLLAEVQSLKARVAELEG